MLDGLQLQLYGVALAGYTRYKDCPIDWVLPDLTNFLRTLCVKASHPDLFSVSPPRGHLDSFFLPSDSTKIPLCHLVVAIQRRHISFPWPWQYLDCVTKNVLGRRDLCIKPYLRVSRSVQHPTRNNGHCAPVQSRSGNDLQSAPRAGQGRMTPMVWTSWHCAVGQMAVINAQGTVLQSLRTHADIMSYQGSFSLF